MDIYLVRFLKNARKSKPLGIFQILNKAPNEVKFCNKCSSGKEAISLPYTTFRQNPNYFSYFQIMNKKTQ